MRRSVSAVSVVMSTERSQKREKRLYLPEMSTTFC